MGAAGHASRLGAPGETAGQPPERDKPPKAARTAARKAAPPPPQPPERDEPPNAARKAARKAAPPPPQPPERDEPPRPARAGRVSWAGLRGPGPWDEDFISPEEYDDPGGSPQLEACDADADDAAPDPGGPAYDPWW